jgi:SAM-dependent methyltransferase
LDTWASGSAYEIYVGRWSRIVAREFVRWLRLPAGLTWLDVGCGTRALAETVLAGAAARRVVGIDPSSAHVEHASAHVDDHRAEFRIGSAESLPLGPAMADATISGLVLNFVGDPAKALGEMRRVTRARGTVAAYVWDYAGQMQMMRHFWDAAVALDGGAADRDEGRRFPIARPEPLAALFREAGLLSVETRALDVATVFRDFDDYWTPFLGGQAPAPGYCMSLDEDRRRALREEIRRRLPIRDDGSIHLLARAWAVRGAVP